MIALLLIETVSKFLQIYSVLIIVRLLLTWFPLTGWMQQASSTLSIVTDPYLNIFRSVIPPMGGMDFSPMLALIVLNIVQSFVVTIPALIPVG